jgi:hypothetical protein
MDPRLGRMGEKMDNATVKLDSMLLEKVRRMISKDNCRIKYANLKQFINIAVLNLIEQEEVLGVGGKDE